MLNQSVFNSKDNESVFGLSEFLKILGLVRQRWKDWDRIEWSLNVLGVSTESSGEEGRHESLSCLRDDVLMQVLYGERGRLGYI